MFAEKKLIILKNLFSTLSARVQDGSASGMRPASGWQENFLENIKSLEEIKDIIIIYAESSPDQRTKFFKALQKYSKCQEFDYLQPAILKKWVLVEFEKNKVKINLDALELLINFVGSDLWQMDNEVKKLSSYKVGGTIGKNDIELLVKPNTDNDIFKTIEALASRDKKQALSLLHKHFNDGEAPLKLLAMIAYQFKTLLIIKELSAQGGPASGWQ